MNISAEAESYSLSDPLTVPELEPIYHEVVLKQDFYGDSYGSEWTLKPYEDMARMLANVIAPTKHCGTSGAQFKPSSSLRYVCRIHEETNRRHANTRSTFLHYPLGSRRDFPRG
jgi:hypothetical protein